MTCLILAFCVLAGNLVAQTQEKNNARDITIVPNSQKWAILVGVNEYNNLKNLNYTVADTVMLRDRLVDIGFLKEQISCLVSGADAENLPTKNNIENQIQLTAKKANEGDLIILTLSGHGVKCKSGKTYFCPSDTNSVSAEAIEKSCVSIDWIYETLDKSEATFKLILVDVCRNDPFEGGISGDDVIGLKGFSNPPDGIILFQSCEEGTVSYEDDELGRGIFTYTLTQGLNGRADIDQDGSISIMDLLTYTMKETNDYASKRLRTSQKPRFSGQTGDFEIVNLGNLSASERETAENFYQEAISLRKGNDIEGALNKINAAIAINQLSESYFNERATILQLLRLQTNVTSGGEKYERPIVTTTDPLKRAWEEVTISVGRRNQLEEERLKLLEDYPPTHAKIKAIEKLILTEGVLYAGYADQANTYLFAEIEIYNNQIKDYLAQGMREDGKTIRELQAQVMQLTQQKENYVNAFQPESYSDIKILFANLKKPNLDSVRRGVTTIHGVEYAFRWCPPGTFMMGSPDNETGRYSNETQHKVTLTQGFWILETEVTQEMWKSVMGHNPSKFQDASNHPVEQVSWNDCQEFILKLTASSEYAFSLPTEAQWEYACRAGTTTPFNFGDMLNGMQANCDGSRPYGTSMEGISMKKTMAVGSYPPNALGLYDMHGNVAEWCLDDERKYTYSADDLKDPVGDLYSSSYVTRGGDWDRDATYCRSARRYNDDKSSRNYQYGFRLVLTGKTPVRVELQGGKFERKVQDSAKREIVAVKDVEYAFCWCPPGTFMMGSPENEAGRDSNEKEHQVTLTKGFWMQETEVTQEMWESVMEFNPSNFKGNNKRPVERVSWDSCQEFIAKLNTLKVAPAGYKFSLPTEAQWEYACRAGTKTRYHFGNEMKQELANVAEHINRTIEVGLYSPNAWGLYDMHGNVSEWCLDNWENHYPEGNAADSVVGMKDSDRVLRDGYWGSKTGDCRSATRFYNSSSSTGSGLGLRLALVPEK